MSRHTLSCCLVVRNEVKQITDCLDTLTILADEIIIVDTGSTDGTPSRIRQWAKHRKAEKNVKILEVGRKFHDVDGDFDFGAAKTFAMNSGTRDYVMWLDATDRVTEQKKIKEFFLKETSKNPNSYFAIPTAMSDKFAFVRVRIGPRNVSAMKGRVHEYMTMSSDELTRHFIPVPIQNYKKGRDLNRNLRLLLKEWEVEKLGRTAFYIALTYKELHNTQEALNWFKRRVYGFEFDNEFREEYFKAYEMVAEILTRGTKLKNVHEADLYDTAREMIDMSPKRFEGYYYLAQYYIKRRDFEQAIKLLRKYKECGKPQTYNLWLNPQIYSGKAILGSIEKCKTALKYAEVLKPDEILDYGPKKGPGSSTMKFGNSQYM